MNMADIVVLIAAVIAIAGLAWFFFAPRRARAAELSGGVQRVMVTVRGGYSPDVVRARRGVPLEVVFGRQESGDCTSRVVFPDLAVNASLPAFGRTTVRLDPATAGQFGFACGMNMIHGTLIIDPDGAPAAPGGDGDRAAAAAAAGPAGDRGCGADAAGAVRGDGPRPVQGRLGARDPAEPLAAAGADHPGDVLHRVAGP